ncbi:MAG: ABC transporter permease, partial [Streptomycetaceae bacterium]|nr:ABC transporter permease [Streptomycetaceae bacterium]
MTPGHLRWLLRRLLLAVLVVYGAASVAFFSLFLIPGDPVRVMLGAANPSPELIAQTRHDTGFDRPVIEQYGLFLKRLVTGDLGTSYQLQESVRHLIGTQIGPTVELAVTALVLALVVSIALAVLTAGRPVARRVSATLELVTASSPSFWIGVLLLTAFSFRLTWFPALGGSGPRGLVLPAITLSLSMIGVFTQVLRAEIERALDEPFVLSARARGSGETAIRLRHALRHGLIPLVTLSGWMTGVLLGGAVVVETVFSRQGLGRTAADAIQGRDFPVVTGVVIVSAI